MSVTKPARPYLLKMQTPANPLKRFEEALPHSRDGLLKLWSELAPGVRVADPGRYFAVQDALEQDIPFPVLVLYVFRESRRALEDNRDQKRAAK